MDVLCEARAVPHAVLFVFAVIEGFQDFSMKEIQAGQALRGLRSSCCNRSRLIDETNAKKKKEWKKLVSRVC